VPQASGYPRELWRNNKNKAAGDQLGQCEFTQNRGPCVTAIHVPSTTACITHLFLRLSDPSLYCLESGHEPGPARRSLHRILARLTILLCSGWRACTTAKLPSLPLHRVTHRLTLRIRTQRRDLQRREFAPDPPSRNTFPARWQSVCNDGDNRERKLVWCQDYSEHPG